MLSTLNSGATRLWKLHIFQRKSKTKKIRVAIDGRRRLFKDDPFPSNPVQAARDAVRGEAGGGTAFPPEPSAPAAGAETPGLGPDTAGPLARCGRRRTLPVEAEHECGTFPTNLKVRVFKMSERYLGFFQSNVLYTSQLTKCPVFLLFPFSKYTFKVMPLLRQWLINSWVWG